jgi:hypothetical protein
VSKFLKELVNVVERRILRVGEKNPNVTEVSSTIRRYEEYPSHD